MNILILILLAIVILWVFTTLIPAGLGLLIGLLIWAFIGWLGGRLARGRGFGFLGNVLVGIVGGVVGTWVLGLLNISVGGDGLLTQIIVGTIGSVILIAVINAFSGRR